MCVCGLQGGQGTKLNQPDYLCRRVLAAKVSKNVFLSQLYTKTIILPRQARDKHRENSKKETVFPQANNTSGVLVFSDWIAASKTNIYALGCVQKEDQITTPWTNRGNLVPNGNMEIVNGLPGQVRSGTLATLSSAVYRN